VKGLTILTALLTWATIVCSALIVTGVSGTVANGTIDARALALVSGLSIAVTLGLVLMRVPPIVGYLVAHGAGVALVLGVVRGADLPWVWRLPLGAAPFPSPSTSVGVATLIVLAIGLTWELSYACAWLVLRERGVWLALGLVVATLTLTGRPGRYAWEFAVQCGVGLALALAAATREQRLLYPRVVRAGLAMRLSAALVAPLAVGLVAAAWLAPLPPAALAHAVRTRDWTGPVERALSRAGVGPEQAGDGVANLTSFGSALRVGGAFQPDGAPVLLARVGDPALSPYWRGAVYDDYAGGVWRPVPSHRVRVGANTPLPLPVGVAPGSGVTATIDLLRPSDTLFAAGPPLRIDVASSVAVGAGVVGALSVGPASGSLAGSYTAVSLRSLPVSATNPLSVTAAPLALPASLRTVDLALPALPSRVRALAQRLTSGGADPYTRAWSIQGYLRGPLSAYRYDTAPPLAPAHRDPVDYFLFSSRRGFCTHFATAMVALARAAGIPARLVTGYSAGHLVGGAFRVTTADAHAWPELWIAGRGWLTFEPTPNFPTPFQTGPAPRVPPVATQRSGANAPTTATAAPTSPAPRATASPTATHIPVATGTTATAATAATATTAGHAAGGGPGGGAPSRSRPRGPIALPWGLAPWSGRPGVLVVAFVVLLAALLLVIGVIVARRRRAPIDAATLYGRMCRTAGALGAAPRRGQTPLEWAGGIAARRPEDGATVLTLAALYARQRYGAAPAAAGELAAAGASWRALRRRWLRHALTRRPLV